MGRLGCCSKVRAQPAVALRSEKSERIAKGYLKHARGVIRDAGADHVAALALDRSLAMLEANLRGSDIHAQLGVVRGARSALSRNCASKRWKKAMFRELRPHALGLVHQARNERVEELIGEAAKVIFLCDQHAARRVMNSREFLRPGRVGMRRILLEIEFWREDHPKAKPVFDADVLWPVYHHAASRYQRGIEEYESELLMQTALQMLADVDPQGVRAVAREIIRKKSKKTTTLVWYARKALRRCRRLPTPDRLLKHSNLAPKNFSREARQVLCAYELFLNIQTDGLPLYFHNLGARWAEAKKGLEVLGLARLAKGLETAARCLTPNGTVPAPAQCARLYNALSPAGLKKLQQRSIAVENGSDAIPGRVDAYIAKHGDAMRKIVGGVTACAIRR